MTPGYFKAAMSGNEREEDGTLIPGDALWVKNVSGISQSVEEMCPYVYEHAYSPHLAFTSGRKIMLRWQLFWMKL